MCTHEPTHDKMCTLNTFASTFLCMRRWHGPSDHVHRVWWMVRALVHRTGFVPSLLHVCCVDHETPAHSRVPLLSPVRRRHHRRQSQRRRCHPLEVRESLPLSILILMFVCVFFPSFWLCLSGRSETFGHGVSYLHTDIHRDTQGHTHLKSDGQPARQTLSCARFTYSRVCSRSTFPLGAHSYFARDQYFDHNGIFMLQVRLTSLSSHTSKKKNTNDRIHQSAF